MSAAIKKLKTAIENTEAILIGAGSGFSTAAGYTYSGERFQRHFADFIEKYHLRDMYSAGFYPSSGSEMKVIFNMFKDEDLDVYRKLVNVPPPTLR